MLSYQPKARSCRAPRRTELYKVCVVRAKDALASLFAGEAESATGTFLAALRLDTIEDAWTTADWPRAATVLPMRR